MALRGSIRLAWRECREQLLWTILPGGREHSPAAAIGRASAALGGVKWPTNGSDGPASGNGGSRVPATSDAKIHALNQAAMKLGQAMYAEQGSGPGGAQRPSAGAPGNEGVVDVKFEEADEEERRRRTD